MTYFVSNGTLTLNLINQSISQQGVCLFRLPFGAENAPNILVDLMHLAECSSLDGIAMIQTNEVISTFDTDVTLTTAG